MTPENIRIRRLSYSDLPQVIAVERRAFPTPWSLGMFVLELSKPSSICLAAVLQEPAAPTDGDARGRPAAGRRETLVGYLICSRYADAWHLMNIATDPLARRRGIARALLSELLERAGAEASYTLEVRTSNTPAIALYESFGFRGAGTRPRYYQDTGEDALIMWRTAPERSVPAG